MNGTSDVKRGVVVAGRGSRSGWIEDGAAAIDRIVAGFKAQDLREATEYLAERVRRRPLQVLAVAAIAGLVVGLLFRRD